MKLKIRLSQILISIFIAQVKTQRRRRTYEGQYGIEIDLFFFAHWEIVSAPSPVKPRS